MKMSDPGLNWLAAWEGGCQTKVYLDSAGYRTIGVGHLITDDDDYQDGVEYPRDELMALFREEDVVDAEAAVNRHVTVLLKPHEFDALASFCFNLGETAFRRSTLLKRVNSGQFDDVPHQLSRWDRAGGRRVRGLARRRKAEGLCFTTGAYNGP